MIRVLLMFLLLAGLLSGCATPAALAPGFETWSDKFLQAMRWQDFPGAARFLKIDLRAEAS